MLVERENYPDEIHNKNARFPLESGGNRAFFVYSVIEYRSRNEDLQISCIRDTVMLRTEYTRYRCV